MTRRTLSAVERARLAKLCGLFGSDYAGERANAARLADRLIRRKGLTWPDVIGSESGPGEKPDKAEGKAEAAGTTTSNVILARELEQCGGDHLIPWDLRFLQSIQTLPRPSDAQWVKLWQTEAKISVRQISAA